jgi:capsular polysaccharide biosynthesis protein
VKNLQEYSLTVVTLISSLLAITAVFGEWGNPLRWILILQFLLFCPGIAFAHLLPGKDQITRVILIVVLSLSIDTAIAQVFLYLGHWSPRLILLTLVEICWLGMFSKFPILFIRSLPTNKLTADSKTAIVSHKRTYLKNIWQMWWVILFSILAAVNFSLVYSYYVASPLYVAVAQFIVTPNNQTNDGNSKGDIQNAFSKASVLSTYANVINSQEIVNATLDTMQEDPANYLRYTMTVTSQPDKNSIQFSVKGPNPTVTAMLANSIGQYAIIFINNNYAAYRIDFLERAFVPIAPSEPRITRNIIFALIIGLVIGFSIAIFRNRISISA